MDSCPVAPEMLLRKLSSKLPAKSYVGVTGTEAGYPRGGASGNGSWPRPPSPGDGDEASEFGSWLEMSVFDIDRGRRSLASTG